MDSLFSIVVLTYNQENLIENTLDSIFKQSYSNIELIISDDASSDETPKIAEQWLKKYSKRFIRTTLITSNYNIGITKNHNRGIRAAKGEFLKYIGGDDLLLPEAIEKMAVFLNKNKNIFIATSYVQPFTSKEDGKIIEFLPLMPEKWAIPILQNHNSIEQFRYMSRVCFLPAPGFFFRTKGLENIDYFDENFNRFEDWHTWLKFLLKGYIIHFLPEVTVQWRIHPNSVSTSALYKGDTSYFKENILVYQKYVLPNKKFLSLSEKIHAQSCIRFYKTLSQNGNRSLLLFKARLNFLLDPIKWTEFPSWIWKQIICNPRKKIFKVFK